MCCVKLLRLVTRLSGLLVPPELVERVGQFAELRRQVPGLAGGPQLVTGDAEDTFGSGWVTGVARDQGLVARARHGDQPHAELGVRRTRLPVQPTSFVELAPHPAEKALDFLDRCLLDRPIRQCPQPLLRDR